MLYFRACYIHPTVHPGIADTAGTQGVNPLSAMVAIWRHIIVSFEVFGTEREFEYSQVKCISERFTGAKSVF